MTSTCLVAPAYLRDPAQWHAFIDALFQTDWVVYAKPAFVGASAVLRYLGRHTHRVAISNHQLLAFDGASCSGRRKSQWRIPRYRLLIRNER
jgi:Putative transposase